MLIRSGADEAKEVQWEEFERLIQSGDIGPDAEVQSEMITGGVWARVGDLAVFNRLRGRPVERCEAAVPKENSLRINTTKYLAWYLVLCVVLGYLPMVMHWFLSRKMWKAIQGSGFARTSPGKAQWLLIVPFYGFYWVFQVYWGFAKDYNAYARSLSAKANACLPHLSEGLFLAYSILYPGSAALLFLLLPVAVAGSESANAGLSVLAGIAAIVLSIGIPMLLLAWIIMGLLILLRVCGAVNQLSDYLESR